MRSGCIWSGVVWTKSFAVRYTMRSKNGGRRFRSTVVPQCLPRGWLLPTKQLRHGDGPDTWRTSTQGGTPHSKKQAIAKQQTAILRDGGGINALGACIASQMSGSVVSFTMTGVERGTSCARVARRRKVWTPRSSGPSTRTRQSRRVARIILQSPSRQRSSANSATDGCVWHAPDGIGFRTSACLAQRRS